MVAKVGFTFNPLTLFIVMLCCVVLYYVVLCCVEIPVFKISMTSILLFALFGFLQIIGLNIHAVHVICGLFVSQNLVEAYKEHEGDKSYR